MIFSNVGGADLFCTLLALFPSTSEAQTYTIATDERLLANGIQVRRHYNQDNEAVLDLMGLSQVMPMFGLADLAEILDLVRHTGATNLSMSRPLKVINYLQVCCMSLYEYSMGELFRIHPGSAVAQW